LTLDVADEPELEWPLARLEGAWMTLGFGDDLESAGIGAMEGMLALMKRELGVEGPDAMGLASLGVDLRITQVVNGSVGVHAVLRDGTFG
jgi:acetamidase/formamidase